MHIVEGLALLCLLREITQQTRGNLIRHAEFRLSCFKEKMSSIRTSPPAALRSARPVCHTAVVELHGLDLVNRFVYEILGVVHAILIRCREFEHFLEIQLREGFRYRLLNTSVRIPPPAV